MLRVAAFWLGQDEGMRCCAELQHCFEKSYCGLLSCEVGRIGLAGAWVFREHRGIWHGRKQKGGTALPQLLEKEEEGNQE